MCALQDGTVLTIGGLHIVDDGAPMEALASVERWWDRSEQWTPTTALPVACAEPTVALTRDGRVLVTGGYDDNVHRRCWLYDANTESWLETGAMATPRVDHTATLLDNGNILVVGGMSALGSATLASSVDHAEIWDAATGRWGAICGPDIPRIGHTATLLPDGRVAIVGGWHQQQPVGPIEVWSPSHSG